MFNVQHNLCDNVTNYCLSKNMSDWSFSFCVCWWKITKEFMCYSIFPMLKDEINDFIIIVIYSLTINEKQKLHLIKPWLIVVEFMYEQDLCYLKVKLYVKKAYVTWQNFGSKQNRPKKNIDMALKRKICYWIIIS